MARCGKKAWLLFTHAASPDSESKMAARNQEILLALEHRDHLVAFALLQVEENECKEWANKLWQSRKKHGHYINLIREMRLHDHSMHFNYF